jgi:rod shape-determining protein MreC
VHDRKVVRRRRAVLGALVGCALILLTAYFGEGPGGALHSLQRGALAVFSPIESVASDALKPFRDLFGWFDDTFEAKGENEKLQKELQDLRTQYADTREELNNARQLVDARELLESRGLADMGPVSAEVTISSPTIWYRQVQINKGSSAGVSVDDPVLSGDGLVGRVTKVVGGASVVTLLTDPKFGVSARTAANIPGIVQTSSPGNPNDLLMTRIPRDKVPKVGEMVMTAGIESKRFTSFAPARIPIGEVTEVDPNELDTSQQIHIRPFADLHNLDVVTVLTEPEPTS